MISFILTSRVNNNPDSHIFDLINSAIECASNPKDQIEFIIKYDEDDIGYPQPTDFLQFYTKYGVRVKYHVWSRGEGRHSIHLDHFYLFSQRNPNSKFVMICADDFVFNRKGFIDEILSIKDEFAFVGYNTPKLEVYGGKDWLKYIEYWKHNEGMCLPCFSTRTAEVLQNFGWQCNADNWQTLINILLNSEYNIRIWHTIAPYYERKYNITGASGYGPTFNNMEIDGSRNCDNPYYFDLVKQQVKNLYLNIKEANAGS